MSKKAFLTGGLAVLLTFGGLAACGDGVDQDNGISDGKQKDEVDHDNAQPVEDSLNEAKDTVKEAGKEIKETLQENGVGDGVDQDNGLSDGEKKDEPDSTNP